jgi:hypothetical protein
MKLDLSSPIFSIISAGPDGTPRRTIEGVAVEWNTIATVSSGQQVKFLPGSLPTDGPAPKFMLDHSAEKPLGMVTERIDTGTAMLFAAKVGPGQVRDEVLAMAGPGEYYDSVSVGVEPVDYTFDENVMIVKSGRWMELSLLPFGAFASAKVAQVAAAEPEPETPTPTDSEEEQVETPETPTAVEAAVPTNIVFASPRKQVELPTAVEYIAAAVAGGDQWRAMSEALRAAAPDIVTTDTPGLLPTPILAPVYNNFVGRRPVVDAVGVRAMPQGGKVFIRPEVTTHTSIGASIGEQSPTAGTLVVFNNQVTKQIFGGYVNISEAEIDWSDPAILSVVLDDMGRIYANATDNYAADTLVAGASVTQAFALADVAKPEVWSAEIAEAAATILTSSDGNLPTHLFLAPNRWQNLLGLNDTANRPLFPQVGPMNAQGNLAPGQYAGNAFGLQVVVDRNFAAGTAIVGDASGYELYEQQKGAMSIESPSTLSRTLAFRGYFAALMIDPTKFVRFTFA